MANENRAQKFIASKVMQTFAFTLDITLEAFEVDGEKTAKELLKLEGEEARKKGEEILEHGLEMHLSLCLMQGVNIFMASLSPEMKLKFMSYLDEDEMCGDFEISLVDELSLRKFIEDNYDDDGYLR